MRIPPNKIAGQMGKLVRVTGWKRGACFVLVSIDGEGLATLRTPKGGDFYYANADSLEYTERNRPKGSYIATAA